MKTFVVLATLLAVALAAPQGFSRFAPQQQQQQQQQGVPGRNLGHPWGPKAFGPGLRNPYAFPPNPFQMRMLQHFTNVLPGARIFVDVNGEAQLTDQYGQEIEDIQTNFGGDLGDLWEF
ncbi:uncharacterized protein LOC143019594 [Oratosquilla oratoria]|uniref:uncharacterized protein LOC143019594 n=1 Tax=Oratosquilla oratoria TaxID=337810 RepID=UPI003F771C3F